jgi:hypothetical protein
VAGARRAEAPERAAPVPRRAAAGAAGAAGARAATGAAAAPLEARRSEVPVAQAKVAQLMAATAVR